VGAGYRAFMELRAFAESVLLSADLDTKLCHPPTFEDAQPGAPVPGAVVPGRPAALPLVSARPVPPMPTPRTIQAERVRGQALHTFAHHELQALELMALALLRFPEAPAGFRMGLAHIIADEQRHFRMYQARAEQWGVSLGEVGAGHVFWKTVSELRDVSAFIAALSLTYEQANLDFAAGWKPAFAAVDDHKTASVLQVVYEDEIRHVAHGVRWFSLLRGGLDFEGYAQALARPLTPGRAKGHRFDREGRLRAGLSAAFVDALEVAPVWRGRPCRVFSFDPFVEEHVAGRTPPARLHALREDLATVPMFLASSDDVVVAPRPSIRTLLPLQRAGFGPYTFLDHHQALADRPIRQLCPWGWSPTVAERLGVLWNPAHAELYDKRWAGGLRARFAAQVGHPSVAPVRGRVCSTVDEVLRLVGDSGTWIAKAPWSSSGQHRVRLQHPLGRRERAWLERCLSRRSVWVEPWYDRVADVSVQLEVSQTGVQIVGLTRFWTAGVGAFRGVQIGNWTHGLPPDVARQVHAQGMSHTLREAGLFVGEQLRERGHRGPAGVDAMVVRTHEGVGLVPILEVNPRTTMGRLGWEIGRRSAGYGAWLFVPLKQLAAAGYADACAFRDAAESLPTVHRGQALRSGVVLTTEPSTAAHLVTVLCVGASHARAADLWHALGMAWPQGR
jgi:uncharacterized ferritin-like protein (DUF455 family)